MTKLFAVWNFCVNMMIAVCRHLRITNRIWYAARNRCGVGGWE
jgi:hypothetical protein